MELTVQNVFGLLLRSKLLSTEECRTMYARWQAEARDTATNVARFAAWMVQNRYVTDYQAMLLARGHADGFFLKDYKIIDRLGKGRMAGVYKAMHQLGQVVAIKVLPPSRLSDPNFLKRFQREAKLAMRLKHPNIVRSFQVGTAGNLHFLVMEYLEGETLEEMLKRRGKLSPTEAVRLVHQALQGLQHIHEQGLVHRDLKPSNLMLIYPTSNHDSTLKATIKILDIGLGRSMFDDSAPDIGTDPGLTGEGVLLGTPDYMAPEQATDARNADIRADIYSLGCVLYHALAGQPPFPDTNIISQMIRHATEPMRPLKQFNPAVPDGLQQILNWMMAKDPAGRYPTPDRAAQALNVFLAAGADPLASPEADPKMRPFLTWLEVEGKKQSPTPAHIPIPASVAKAPNPADHSPLKAALHQPTLKRALTEPTKPAAGTAPPVAEQPITSVPPPPIVPAERQRGKSRGGQGRKRKKSRSGGNKVEPAPGLALVDTGSIPSMDVELVGVTPPEPPPAPTRGWRFGLRDFLVFLVGAGLGGLAVFLGFLFAYPRP